MKTAAKKKSSLAMGVIASMIALVATCLLSSAAIASSVGPTWSTTASNDAVVGPKTRAEVSGVVRVVRFENRSENPVNSSSNYDSLGGVAIECTVAPVRTAADDIAFMGAKDQPFVPDLSHITGKTAASRNRAIQSLIKEDLPDMKFTHMPEYSPFVNSGVAMKDMGTQIGFKRFSSRTDLRRVLVHEELHHRWFKRGVPGPLHHSNDYVPDEKFYKVIDRYFKMRGWDN